MDHAGGRGKRPSAGGRLAPSVEMLESSAVEALLSADKIVLAAGGGGVAVSHENGRYLASTP